MTELNFYVLLKKGAVKNNPLLFIFCVNAHSDLTTNYALRIKLFALHFKELDCSVIGSLAYLD